MNYAINIFIGVKYSAQKCLLPHIAYNRDRGNTSYLPNSAKDLWAAIAVVVNQDDLMTSFNEVDSNMRANETSSAGN
jgi:hypothetical protein